MWEIGTPDRSAAEFFVPEPDPKYINKLYVNHPDRFRQYGLWERYTDLYPDKDLVYTIGVSEYHKDWFYAQVTRKAGSDMYTVELHGKLSLNLEMLITPGSTNFDWLLHQQQCPY